MELIATYCPAGAQHRERFRRRGGQAAGIEPAGGQVAFTGETTTGRLIMQYASENLIRSRSSRREEPNIFLADVMEHDDDFLDKAIEGFVMFASTRVRSAPARRAPSSTSRSTSRSSSGAWSGQGHHRGNPLDPNTCSCAGVERPARKISPTSTSARRGSQGADRRRTPHRRGLRGRLLRRANGVLGDNSMRIFQEEIFGPVLAVTTFKHEAEAIRIANDTLYGLGAGVWTRDGNSAYRLGRPSRPVGCGQLLPRYPAHAAFGGYKGSASG